VRSWRGQDDAACEYGERGDQDEAEAADQGMDDFRGDPDPFSRGMPWAIKVMIMAVYSAE
jgi:hypothetical protein